MIHNEYMHENPRINRQDRQKIMLHGSAYPKEISQWRTPTTHTEAVHCQGVLLGVFHLSLTINGSWIHLGGRVAKPLVSPPMPSC